MASLVGSNSNSFKDSLWQARVGSALRTVLACAMVGCATLYGPDAAVRLVKYPSFSYMTTILIVSEATLGDSFRGFAQVTYATIQVMGPSVLALWAMGPAWFATELAAVVSVAVAAFVVALPESTPLLSKRIAFGQIVLIFVGIFVDGGHHTGGVFYMQPIHMVACTALGAFASVFALLLPFPKLAYYQVKKGCTLYAENASERVGLIVDAISSHDTTTAQHLISQLTSLSKQGPNLLQHLKTNLGGMAWERPFLRMDWKNLRDIEKLMQGMEIALSSCSVFPVGFIDQQDLHKHLQHSKLQIALKLERAKCFMPSNEGSVEPGITSEQLWNPDTTSSFTSPQNLPALFLLYCLEFLQDDHRMFSLSDVDETKLKAQRKPNFKKSWDNFLFAFKCSVSLALAVLFGLIYSKENSYWAGLTIAITFVTGRQATFMLANARAQGTAMGSVYGLLCVFLFRRCMDFRFVSLLPWIIFTSLLIHSKTYGQAGAFSAVIGALVIVGRKGYGAPTDFAIARLTEATIGLICFILVDLLMNLSRATSLIKVELSQSLGLVESCVDSISVFPDAVNELRENRKKLRHHVKELEKFTEEAEKEPNFWFRPFDGVRYRKLLGSFSTLKNLIHFIVCQTEFLSQYHGGGDLEELLKRLNDDVKVLKKKIRFGTELENKDDVEMGEPNSSVSVDDILSDFFIRLEEVMEKVQSCEAGTNKFKRQMLLCLSGFGFCIRSMVVEVKEMEKQVKELIKFNNSSTKA